ncbi:prenyltransferase/squalene oxidase repeat-containing protein [Mariniblastus fucicola]|uniref:Prenyltransferase and squalene oxidase repeat protein n=1 Tax=Mariniblastus fucicola TaxID=980251 RepID=A0A5B9PFR7_9BACT|nr:prenyltransferase/squalene oxidase repeat-containing protein [Mariniblastus fucicola]QEG24409.1 Prenyltransferase and squalene oxidase repeat protein [Mariniblastus fucicola]
MDRRAILKIGLASSVAVRVSSLLPSKHATAACFPAADKVQLAIDRGLEFLVSKQSRVGGWADESHQTAITSLAGTALICSGSTTTQGPYAKAIRYCVDFLLSKCRRNGLIGATSEQRYTYGHGFAMLFLSQVLGEEEDIDRREELVDVLERAVKFSVNAQTKDGGWGYVSGDNFDEGSTTITQVQGLRGCRNAGIVVPKLAIEKAKRYIYKCQNSDGGIKYSIGSRGGDSRPAITAAALAALFNAGDYQSKHIAPMWAYCKKHMHDVGSKKMESWWHYTYLYYSQVVYRQGPSVWDPFRDQIYKRLLRKQKDDGSWVSADMGQVYPTSINLIILQLDYGYLPIFQR